MKQVTVLAALLAFLAGCGQAPAIKATARPKPAPQNRQWVPPKKVPGELSVELRPANAKVEITSLDEANGIIPVKIKVLDYGNENGNPGNAKSYQVGVLLTKRRFLSQRFEILGSRKETTANLLGFTFAPEQMPAWFSQASRLYNLPMAYPTYLPTGFKLKEAEFQDYIQAEPGSTGLLFFRWAKGDQIIYMGFSPAGMRPLRSRTIGEPPHDVSTIRIGKNLAAKLDNTGPSPHVKFIVNGQEATWQMSLPNLPKREIIRILKGIKLVG